MTGELDSAGVGPLNGYRLLSYYSTWTAGAHPVKQCRLLSRVGFPKSSILLASKGSLLGGCDIAEPVLFERQWLVENSWHGQSEMVPLSRWQVGASLGIEPHDLGVETLLHSEVPPAICFVFHMVAMLPLIPCKVVELNKETFGPSLARFAESFLVVVALLELSP